jgi:hypothetical protein
MAQVLVNVARRVVSHLPHTCRTPGDCTDVVVAPPLFSRPQEDSRAPKVTAKNAARMRLKSGSSSA